MLYEVFEQLDAALAEDNPGPPAFVASFDVFGQSALLESGLKLKLAATGDLDAYTKASWSVLGKFDTILKQYGLKYDNLSAEAWMPVLSMAPKKAGTKRWTDNNYRQKPESVLLT